MVVVRLLCNTFYFYLFFSGTMHQALRWHPSMPSSKYIISNTKHTIQNTKYTIIDTKYMVSTIEILHNLITVKYLDKFRWRNVNNKTARGEMLSSVSWFSISFPFSQEQLLFDPTQQTALKEVDLVFIPLIFWGGPTMAHSVRLMGSRCKSLPLTNNFHS